MVRRLVAQQFQQALNPVVVLAGAEQDRDQEIGAQRLGELAVYVLLVRVDLLQKLFEQSVVEIRQGLQQFGARLGLPVRDAAGQLDQRGRFTLPIAVGALADEIDIAGDPLAVADRHLTQRQRPGRESLQGGQDFAHGLARLVHLVDQDDMGNVVIVEKLEDRARRRRLRRFGLDHDDGDIGDHAGVAGIQGELDATRRVDEGPVVAKIGAVPDREFRARPAVPRFRSGVADGVPVLDRAFAVDRAAGVEQGFEEAGLAGLIGTEDRGAAGRAATLSAAFCRSGAVAGIGGHAVSPFARPGGCPLGAPWERR